MSERRINDKIAFVGDYKSVQVRRVTIVERDGVEIARTLHRHVLQPGTLDADDNLVDTDISGEDSDVQGICNSVWTQSVKDAWKAKLIADKNLHPGG